jgi:hypothetical protein
MASGDTLLIIDAVAGRQPTSSYAVWGQRNDQDHYAFDGTADESLLFRAIMPQHYAGGGITVRLHWRATSATSGDVIWNTALERQTGLDTDADSFATAQAATTTTSGTAGIPTSTTITHTSGAQMDSVVAGDGFRLKVTRDADNGSDTMNATDAELLQLEIREV